MLPNELQQAWQSQPAAMTPLTAMLLHRQDRRFRWELRFASAVTSLVWLAFAGVFAAAALLGEVLLCRIGCAILAVSLAYVPFYVDWGQIDPTLDCRGNYRATLTRCRDKHAGFLRWHTLPQAPGVALALTGWLLSDPARWVDATMMAAFWIGLQVACGMQSKTRTRQLQHEIDLLDA